MALTSEQISVANELLTAMGKTRSWVSISDLGALLTREQIEDFIGKIRSKKEKDMDRSKSSEAYPGEIEDAIIEDLKDEDFVIEGSVEEGFKVSEHFARESMKQKQFIHLEDIDLGALATVIEKSMQKHLDYGTFHATRQLSATEIPEVLRKNIALAQKNKGISNDSVEKIDVDAIIEATRRKVENYPPKGKLEMTVDNIINTMYPDLENLPPIEQKRAAYERALLMDLENAGVFVNYIKSAQPNSRLSQMSQPEKFKAAMWHVLAEKYCSILNPDDEDRNYIIKNTKEIEGLLIEIEPESPESKLTEREQLKNAMKELKMEQWIKIMHPEYEKMTPEDRFLLRTSNPKMYETIKNDTNILLKRFDAIDSDVKRLGNSEKRSLDIIMNHHKIEIYTGILYPKYADLSVEEKYLLEDQVFHNDQSFVSRNIKAIDSRYVELRAADGENGTPQQDLIRQALEEVRADLEKANAGKTNLDKKEEELSSLETERKEKENIFARIARKLKETIDPGED